MDKRASKWRAVVTANFGAGPMQGSFKYVTSKHSEGRRLESEADDCRSEQKTHGRRELIPMYDKDNVSIRHIQRLAPEKLAQLIFVREGETADDIPDR